jgi:putative ATP-binding cassette transporter
LHELGFGSVVKVQNDSLSRLTLSTGQHRRLALLQRYADGRDLCFFDEWAADQYPHFRKHLYYVLLPELKGRGKPCSPSPMVTTTSTLPIASSSLKEAWSFPIEH